MATVTEKGSISIHTENIFPIIKKFLYSDHEIFLRELVSNAVDATQKLKKLASMGEFNGELGDLKIEVSFDKKKKTITVSDKGLGMTAEELKAELMAGKQVYDKFCVQCHMNNGKGAPGMNPPLAGVNLVTGDKS